MPQLRELEVGNYIFSSMRLDDGQPVDSWKDIFDTLRNRPSLIYGRLDICFSITWTLRLDKSNVLEDWGGDDRGYNRVQREYRGQKYDLFQQALVNPRDFRRLLDEEHERGVQAEKGWADSMSAGPLIGRVSKGSRREKMIKTDDIELEQSLSHITSCASPSTTVELQLQG